MFMNGFSDNRLNSRRAPAFVNAPACQPKPWRRLVEAAGVVLTYNADSNGLNYLQIRRKRSKRSFGGSIVQNPVQSPKQIRTCNA